MSESSLSTRWWNQTRLQRATEKTYLSQLAAAQVQPNLKMRTAASAAVGSTKTASAVASVKPSWKPPDRIATMNPYSRIVGEGRGLGKDARRRIASGLPHSS
jgi:hypothetical protein